MPTVLLQPERDDNFHSYYPHNIPYLIITNLIYRLHVIFRILVHTGAKNTGTVLTSSIVILFIMIFKAADEVSNFAQFMNLKYVDKSRHYLRPST